jgi:hypothetical protein
VLETAGVPRGLFGQHKKAASRPYQGMRHTVAPQDFLSPTSYESFLRFLAEREALYRGRFRQGRARTALSRSRLVTSPKISRLLDRLGLDTLSSLKWRYSKEVGEVSVLFHWALALQRERYRRALVGDRSSIAATHATTVAL